MKEGKFIIECPNKGLEMNPVILRNQLEQKDEWIKAGIESAARASAEIAELQSMVDWWTNLTAKYVSGKHSNMRDYVTNLQAVVEKLNVFKGYVAFSVNMNAQDAGYSIKKYLKNEAASAAKGK